MIVRFVSLLVVLSVIGCAEARRPGRFSQHRFNQDIQTARGARELKFTDETSGGKSAKIFLIAGSEENANFAQEIVEQRLYWLDQGFSPDEIVCFYAMPSDHSFQEDRAQFSVLAHHLAACKHANARDIFRAIREAGGAGHDFLYVYVTSHGNPPLADLAKMESLDFPTRVFLSGFARQYPELAEQYAISIDGSPSGRTATLVELAEELGESTASSDLFFTPRYLKQAIDAWPEQTPKYVVLQACHSGGFIEDPREDFQRDLLGTVPNLIAMTASRYDRSSFGCDSGSHRTYFGGTFNDVLFRIKENPNQIQWKAFYRAVKRRVEKMEKSEEVEKESLPSYLDSRTLTEER